MELVKTKPGSNGGELAARASDPFFAIQREIDRAFERAWRMFGNGDMEVAEDFIQWPAIDVTEDEKSVTLKADIPGVEAKNLDLQVLDNVLTVSGSREEEKTEEKEGYKRQERRSGSFSRTVTLPEYVDASKVDAKYEKGVLTVTAPKIPGRGPKRVAVKTG